MAHLSRLGGDVAPRRRAWLKRLALVAISFAVTVVLVRLAGRIDWPEVWDALTHLSWWQPFVLVVVLVVRQVLNAIPLALYIPGVSVFRATVNDLGAIVMSTLAPPPSDLALRVAMFNSWGVPTAKGLAGTVMNTLTFYIVRFSAPAVGFVLLAVTGRQPGLRWLELLSILIAVAILGGVLLVVRSEALATSAGLRGGRLARRFRPAVDPEAWAEACRTFRRDIAARFRHGFPRSLVGLVGMLAADLAMLTMCLRFVGVSSAEVSLVEIAIAYLFAYPFTIFPFQGLGIVDGLILVAVVDYGGADVEAAAVAALIVWRVFTLAGPVLMGLAALATWRRSVARDDGDGRLG